MIVEFELTPREVKEVYRFLEGERRQANRGPLHLLISILWVFGGGGLAAMVLFLVNGRKLGQAQPPFSSTAAARGDELLIFATIMVFTIITLVTPRLWRGWRRRREIRRRGWITKRFRIDADPQRIVIDDSQARYEFPWRQFVRPAELPQVFVLFDEAKNFWIIPKRAFGGHEAASAFRWLLNQYVQPRTGGFPIAEAEITANPASYPVLRLEFLLTPEEGLEYSGARARLILPARRRLQSVGLFFLFAAYYVFTSIGLRTMGLGSIESNIALAWVTSLVMLIAAGWLVLRVSQPPKPTAAANGSFVEPQTSNANSMKLFIGVLVMFGVMAVVPMLLMRGINTTGMPAWRRTLLNSSALRMGPLAIAIAVIFALAWLISLINRRRPGRPLRVEFAEHQIVLDGATSKGTRHWSDVERFLESPNLFILFFADAPIIVPKRFLSFDGRWSVDAFRNRLRGATGLSASPRGL